MSKETALLYESPAEGAEDGCGCLKKAKRGQTDGPLCLGRIENRNRSEPRVGLNGFDRTLRNGNDRLDQDRRGFSDGRNVAPAGLACRRSGCGFFALPIQRAMDEADNKGHGQEQRGNLSAEGWHRGESARGRSGLQVENGDFLEKPASSHSVERAKKFPHKL